MQPAYFVEWQGGEKSPIIPDFAATLFRSHIGSDFKPGWIELLFFPVPFQQQMQQRLVISGLVISSASLKLFSPAMQKWDTNLFFFHFVETCTQNVVYLFAQQISSALQRIPLS